MNSMKTATFIALTLIGVVSSLSSVFGQSRFSILLNVAPTYTHNATKQMITVADATSQLVPTEFITKSNSVGYSAGLMGRYALSTRWSASVGVWATQLTSTKGDFSFNGSQSSINYHNTHPFSFAYKIPLLINYQLSDKRLSPYFSAGVSLNFRAKSYVDLGNGEEVAVTYGKPVVVTPLVGAGAIYRINGHLSIIAQPTIQYNLPHSTYSYYRSYQLSLQTQVMYNF